VIVVDSSGWIEFFSEGALADEYAARMRTPAAVITPTIVLYEVYKRLKRDLSEEDAVIAVGAMRRTRVVPLDDELALTAADVSLGLGLAMAEAEVVTSDADFKGIAGVTYLAKP
jgi:hypothetical protein